MTVKKLLATLVLVYCAAAAFAQTAPHPSGINAPTASQPGEISGRIIDANTFKPLLFATVYLNQTTFGATTNDEGDFLMKNIPAGRYDIVVSYLGYKRYQARIVVTEGALTAVAIKLVPSSTNLREVTVRANRDKRWKNRYDRFQKYFFGISPHTASCRILNPGVLDLVEKDGIITATTSDPLQIENLGLGYIITCELKECVVGPNLHRINGTYQFKEAETADTVLSNAWHKSRVASYLGSTRHLLRTLVQNRTQEEGFQLYSDISNNPDVIRNNSFVMNLNFSLKEFPSYNIADSSETENVYVIKLPARTEVHYLLEPAPAKIYRSVAHPVSWIEVADSLIEVSSSGVILNPGRMTVAGAMSDAHIAELLPINFEVAVNTNYLATARKPHSEFAVLVEKPYLMTDKPYYYPSDKIMFKTFFNYAAPAYRDSLSHVINVELINSNGKIVHKKSFSVRSGSSNGDFALSETIQPGDYTLRAYTRWMMNFDEKLVFTKPIKIIQHQRLGVATDHTPAAKNLNILTERDEFEVREKITLTLEALNFYADPVAADLAISVTDMEMAAVPVNEWNILSQYPITNEMLPDTSMKGAKYLIQYGTDFKGRMVIGRKKNPVSGVLTVYQQDVDDVFTIMTDASGSFYQQVQVIDSTVFFVDAKTVKGKRAKIVLEEVPSPAPPIVVGDTLQLNTYRPSDASKFHTPDPYSTARMLEAVTIEAKKIESSAGAKHLMSDSHLTGERLEAMNSQDLLSALRSLVSGLKVLYIGTSMGPPIRLLCFPGMNSFGDVQEVMVEIDGVAWNSSFSGETAADKLASMSASEVESVDVIRFGMAAAFGARAANGVIVITTRLGSRAPGPRKLDPSRYQTVNLDGYSKAEEFVSPDYSVQTNGDDRLDLRSTIYWNPFVGADGKDPVKISFYAADIPTRYRIVVEGVTANGEAVRGEKIIVVRGKK